MSEYELGWSLAAFSLLIKPQAICLLPVLGLWTLLSGEWRQWWRAALAFIAVLVIGVAPFQIGHSLSWLPQLYLRRWAITTRRPSMLLTLWRCLAGLRQNDSATLSGISYFAIGMGMLVPLYAYIAFMMWRNPSPPQSDLYVVPCGVRAFSCWPRESTNVTSIAALILVVPLAVEEPAMLAVYALLTMTTLINLIDVLYDPRNSIFLDCRDALAMTVSR